MDDDEELARRRLGSTVADFTLERVLGTGGVGAVYAARNSRGDAAAVKILHRALARKKDVQERFLREATLANKIDHAGALRILAHGWTADGAGYLLMELLEGETMTELIRQDGPLGFRELFGYLDQALDVLVAAHSSGIIHRDLKPDNLFITVTGKLKVLDFGLARRLSDIKGDFKTKTGLALGTLPYMAPEQALGRRGEVDARVDLFALGATAFRVLGRRKLHEADSEAELLMKMASEPAPALRLHAPNTPEGVQQVVDLALAFAKEARYPDAATMQQDVRDVLAGRAPRHAAARQQQRETTTRVARAVTPPVGGRRVPATAPLHVHPGATEPLPASSSTSNPVVTPMSPAPLALPMAQQHHVAAELRPPAVPLPANARVLAGARPPRRAALAIAFVLLLAGAVAMAFVVIASMRSSTPSAPPIAIPAATPRIAERGASPAETAENSLLPAGREPAKPASPATAPAAQATPVEAPRERKIPPALERPSASAVSEKSDSPAPPDSETAASPDDKKLTRSGDETPRLKRTPRLVRPR